MQTIFVITLNTTTTSVMVSRGRTTRTRDTRL